MPKHSRTKAWAMLMGAIALEILGLNLLQVFHAHATLDKVLLLIFMNVSYFLMSLALRQISVGVAYATWEIVGGVGVLLTSFVFFAPNLSPQHYVGIAVGFTGIVFIILGEEHSGEKGLSVKNSVDLADKSVNLAQNLVNFTENSAQNSLKFSKNPPKNSTISAENSAPKD